MEIDCVVSDVLGRMISSSRSQPNNTSFIKFQSSYVPEVSVLDYLQRIRKYAKISDSCLVLMLIYVDRAIERKKLVLSSLNVHRLLIVAVMLAAKFHEDLFFNNAYYAQLGGLTLNELNVLELELLTLLDFSLHVNDTTFSKYFAYLSNYSPFNFAAPSPKSIAICENAFQFVSPLDVLSPSSPVGLALGPPTVHVPKSIPKFSPCATGLSSALLIPQMPLGLKGSSGYVDMRCPSTGAVNAVNLAPPLVPDPIYATYYPLYGRPHPPTTYSYPPACHLLQPVAPYPFQTLSYPSPYTPVAYLPTTSTPSVRDYDLPTYSMANNNAYYYNPLPGTSPSYLTLLSVSY